MFAALTVPREDVTACPVKDAKVVLITVGKVASTFVAIPVSDIIVVGAPSAVPCEEVTDCPVGFTEYSTPQPEFPHCCLLQPSTLNDCGVPSACYRGG